MNLLILILLGVGFWLLFLEGRVALLARSFYERTLMGLDAASRRRNLEERKRRLLGAEGNIWSKLERNLYYSGIKLRFPHITVELWLAMHLVVVAITMVLGGGLLFDMEDVLLILLLFGIAERIILQRLRTKNRNIVGQELPQLLDFLGNYSITSGEITGVLLQVSRYIEYPLSRVLESCYYEAQTTGDTKAALLAMKDKIEHPKFKELVTNMEVSIRYCSDFSSLVSSSKRTLREYLKNAGERSGMMREALVSMALLLGMSYLVLWVVGHMVELSVPAMLFGTLPGKVALAGVGIIALMFYYKINRIHS